MHYLYELLQKLMVIYLQDSACYRSINFTAPITTPQQCLGTSGIFHINATLGHFRYTSEDYESLKYHSTIILHSLKNAINAIASTPYRNSNYIVAYANRETIYCTLYHTRNEAFHHGNTSRLQKEFEVYRLVRLS
jgi:hypothetical protein